jgi:hypothetical protein
MKEIVLTKGKIALVDDSDFEKVSQFKWYASFSGNLYYAIRNVWIKKEKRYTRIYLHRYLLDLTDPTAIVDHINGNTLDNRSINLRICNYSQNTQNSKRRSTNTSGYKGVSFKKDIKKWEAYICPNYKKRNLGWFDTKEEAAKAYNEAASEYYGQFAKLNEVKN